MKRNICISLALLLAFATLFCGCGGGDTVVNESDTAVIVPGINDGDNEVTTSGKTESAEEVSSESAKETESVVKDSEALTELKRKFLKDYTRFLRYEEAYYAYSCWVLSYVEAFMADHTWENLQKARVALSTAESFISSLSNDDFELTEEDIATLTAEGYTAVATFDIKGSCEEGKAEFLDIFCRDLKQYLYLHVFAKVYDDYSAKIVANLKNICQANIEYAAYMTEYVLFLLNNQEVNTDMLEYMVKNTPEVYSLIYPLDNDESVIFGNVMKALDDLENYTVEYAKTAGELKVANDKLLDMLANKDTAAIKEQRVEIKNAPVCVPTANLSPYYNTVYMYYSVDEAGEVSVYSPLDKIDELPNRETWCYPPADEEGINDHYETLLMMGYDVTDPINLDGMVMYTVNVGENKIKFIYTEEQAIVGPLDFDVMLVPTWYVD